MRNIALTLAYDGAAYHGWQRQNNGITVQEVLETTLARIVKAPVTLYGCSRTDSGVHAMHYVANFRAETRIPEGKIPFALNALLPPDIRVFAAKDMPEDFHARFCAKGKTYRYKIDPRPFADPFLVHRAWHYPYALDKELLFSSAHDYIGTHDFSAFMAAGGQVKTTVRTIYDCHFTEEDGLYVMSVTGNGFLYNMVRIMVGTCIAIAAHKLPPKVIPSLLNQEKRDMAQITAPPDGLYLAQVYFDEISSTERSFL